MKHQGSEPRKGRPLLAAIIGFMAACLGLPAHAATSFPEYPLQTGTGSIPPNIMFILDDSGSMTYQRMPAEGRGLGRDSDFQGRTYVFNTIYYDPRIDYQSWMTPDGTRMEGGTNYRAAYADFSLATGAIDLSDSGSCFRSRQNDLPIDVCGGNQTFYVPKDGASNLSSIASYYRYRIDTDRRMWRCERVGGGWDNCGEYTPTNRPLSEELANYATWFSYHRTRMKVAKAGTSEAFGELGENFRVGYDSIWNRNGRTAVSGNLPASPIPVQTSDGLFNGQNRENWFDYLFRAEGSGYTPLHGALQRTGSYFEAETGETGPWGPQSAPENQLSCRQNFAILTTDGYWNNYTDFTEVGNVDGTEGEPIESADGEKTYTYSPALPYEDSFENTLADVAMHYWKRDLRDDLDNNVPSSSQNPAFWQHLSTFGISIGLQGTIPPEDVPLIESGDKAWPNPIANSGAERIDDLLHASVNGRGEFVAASNPVEFAKALKDSLAAIQRRRSSGSNVASNGPSLNSGSHIFQATYTSGEWSGDVVATSIVGGRIAATPSWSMAEVANESPAEFYQRDVYTWSGSNGVDFPTTLQQGLLAREEGEPGGVTGTQNANYIKGSRAREGSGANSLRKRASPIGDIVNSSPFYVAESDSLYIGANDGMLHGVDASTGKTMFSYVPAGLDFQKLAQISSQDYQHHFFVDGGIDVTTTSQGDGRNILVGSLGRGGKGVFALDVTNPEDFAGSNVLWDRTAIADTDMGHVLGAPLVRQGNDDGKVMAIVPNGIDSTSGRAALYIYVLNSNGSIASTRKIYAGTETGNGLAEARAADVTGDGRADYIYAGDLRGNVWKFDVTSSNPNQWDVAHRQGGTRLPMFTAVDASGNRQPITAAVALAREPQTGRIFVLFGTGRYITNGDLTDTSTQTLYGLIDDDARITGRGDLHERTIPLVGVDSLGRAARSWEPHSALPAGKRGWYVDLGIPTAGERVVSAPFVRTRALWFSSIIPQPGSGCDSGGTGYLNAVDAFTGTNPINQNGQTFTFIDVNADGEGNDKLAGQSQDGDVGFITSVDVGIGMPTQGIGVGNNIYACGSDAECGHVPTPPSGDAPQRLRWRELFDRN